MTAAQDSRAQFEAWFRKEFRSELYCSTQWMAWQASRAALSAELTEEREATDNWRRLALQFDGHRMRALWHLRAIASAQNSLPARISAAEDFLRAPPLSGEQVLAERIAALAAAAPQPAAQERKPLLKTLTSAQIASICLSYRHDFGLMNQSDRLELITEARAWMHAIDKEISNGMTGEPK